MPFRLPDRRYFLSASLTAGRTQSVGWLDKDPGPGLLE